MNVLSRFLIGNVAELLCGRMLVCVPSLLTPKALRKSHLLYHTPFLKSLNLLHFLLQRQWVSFTVPTTGYPFFFFFFFAYLLPSARTTYGLRSTPGSPVDTRPKLKL